MTRRNQSYGAQIVVVLTDITVFGTPLNITFWLFMFSSSSIPLIITESSLNLTSLPYVVLEFTVNAPLQWVIDVENVTLAGAGKLTNMQSDSTLIGNRPKENTLLC